MSRTPANPPQQKKKSGKWLLVLACLNLTALCVVSYLLYGVSETWWVGTVLTYAPRSPYLVPTVMLLLASLFWHRESLGINLVSLMIVLVPIMGLSLPFELWLNGSPQSEGETSLKIVSCNVQAFEPHFEKILDEISKINPDVVAMQETFRGDPRLDEYFRDWHTLHHGHFWVGSRFPLSLIGDIHVPQFGGRKAGLLVTIDTPAGQIVLCDLHQMTARWGLKELDQDTLIDGSGIIKLEEYEHERYLESIDIRSAVDAARNDRPLIVCGDFNTPTSSSLFQRHWGDLRSAFDVATFGYGYTSPCKSNRFWPHNFPWARIDHILCSNEWSIRKCLIGTSDGSDHRLIAAKVALKPRLTATVKVEKAMENSPQ